MFRFIRDLFGGGEVEPVGQPLLPPARPDPLIEHNLPTVPTYVDVPDFFARDFRFVALDVETANGNRHSICQIGLAAVCDQGKIECASFLVDPAEPFDGFNVNLHGISAKTVAGQPGFREILQATRAFLERHTIIQHSNFDRLAFAAACDRDNLDHLSSTWLDSVLIARKAWPELSGNGGHGLGNLKKVLKLNFAHHDAGEDARAAAQVVLLAEAQTKLRFDGIASSRKAKSYQKAVVRDGDVSGPLFGKAVCFTGKLSLDRADAANLAAAAGMDVKSTVSKKLSYLVVGDQDLTVLNGHGKSSKHRRAEELIEEGTPILIIGESDFVKLIRS